MVASFEGVGVTPRIGFARLWLWGAIQRVVLRMALSSESCSENGLFTPRVIFSKFWWPPAI